MTMRISFTLDDGLLDMIDQYAKEHLLDRNKAILELIENGLAAKETSGEVKLKQNRSFEEIQAIKTEIQTMKTMLSELKSEIRLMSHILDSDWRKEARIIPYQGGKWWMFWKR